MKNGSFYTLNDVYQCCYTFFADKDISSTKMFGSRMMYCPPKPVNASTNCNSTIAPCLYNIKKDPCEFYNIAPWNQGKTRRLIREKSDEWPCVICWGHFLGGYSTLV